MLSTDGNSSLKFCNKKESYGTWTCIFATIDKMLSKRDVSQFLLEKCDNNLTSLHSFLQCWNPPFLMNPLFSGYPSLSEANLKSYRPVSESYPNWCTQTVRNTLKWRCYVSYYNKSIESIINITLFTLGLNSVFTTDTFFG